MKEEIKVKDNKPLQWGCQVGFQQLNKPVNIIVWCRDEYAITYMDNMKILKRMVEVEQKCGTNIKLIKDKDKTLAIQKYKKKSKEEILDIIKKEIRKSSGGNFKEQ